MARIKNKYNREYEVEQQNFKCEILKYNVFGTLKEARKTAKKWLGEKNSTIKLVRIFAKRWEKGWEGSKSYYDIYNAWIYRK